jgi:predicted transposase/invertase (TIGR01784 family)
MDIKNPHDRFFKETFSDIEAAQDFITGTFPESLVKKLDLSTLELDANTYTDNELKEHFSDLVYNCRYGNDNAIKIVILFEHKSSIPEYPHLQIIRYLLKIWETNVKQNAGLIPVIPVIFYHGKEKWEMKSFADYFNNIDELLFEFIPNIHFLLTDCSQYSDKQIKNEIFHRVVTKIAVLLMKDIFDEERIQQKLVDIFHLGMLYFKEEKGLRYLETVLRYLFANIGEEKQNTVFKTISEISFEGGNNVMTIEEALLKKGEEKGIEKGIEKGKLEIAQKMLAAGIPIENIAQFTSLPIEEIKKLK